MEVILRYTVKTSIKKKKKQQQIIKKEILVEMT